MSFCYLLKFFRVNFKILLMAIAIPLFPVPASELNLNSENQEVSIDHYLTYFPDPEGNISFGDVRNKEFLPLPNGSPNLGFPKGGVWFKADVQNIDRNMDWIFALNYPILDKVDFYIVYPDGSSIENHGGDTLPFQNRFLNNRRINFAIPHLNNQPNTQNRLTIIYRVETGSSFQGGGVIYSMNKFSETSISDAYGNAIFSGGLFLIAAYNLFIYFFIKDIKYIYYVMYIFSILIFQNSTNGVIYQYILSDYPEICNPLPRNFGGITLLSIMLFTGSYLNLKQYPGTYKIHSFILKFLFGFSMIAFFLENSLVIRTSSMIGVCMVFSIIYFCIVSVKNKNQDAKYFILAWTFFLIGAIIFLLKTLGLIPASFISYYALQIGSLTEALLLSVGLAKQIDRLKKETDYLNKNLENLVEKRTHELSKTSKDLESLNDFLYRINSLSGLEEIFKEISIYFHQKYKIGGCWLFLNDEKDENLITFKANSFIDLSQDQIDFMLRQKIPINEKGGIFYLTFKSQKPFYLPKIKKIEFEYDKQLVDYLKPVSIIFVPLVSKNKTVGILVLSNFYEKMELTKNEIKSISIFSSQISGTIDSRRLLNQIESSNQDTEKLNVLLRSLNETLDIKEILQKVFKYIGESYKFQNHGLYKLVSTKDAVQLVEHSFQEKFSQDVIEKLESFRIPIKNTKGAHALCIHANKPIFFQKIWKRGITPEEKFVIEEFNIKSFFMLPLHLKGELIGILDLSSEETIELKKEDISRFSILGEQLSGIIYNAQLFEETQRAREAEKLANLELKEAQSALSRAERSASINSMISHLAHEVNNPLNYISTGDMITRESFQEAKEFILNAIPESEESKAFREKLNGLFQEMEVGMSQTKKGAERIKETISEIRAITGVDGLHLENFDPLPLLYSNLELTLEKNQIYPSQVEIYMNETLWPSKYSEVFQILSQKYIFSRAIRTLLNNSLVFALRASHPIVKIELKKLSYNLENLITISLKNNGPPIDQGRELDLFDLKSNKYFGTELIGYPIVKELLKTVQCNISLVDHGRSSGWVEFQVILKNFE